LGYSRPLWRNLDVEETVSSLKHEREGTKSSGSWDFGVAPLQEERKGRGKNSEDANRRATATVVKGSQKGYMSLRGSLVS